ncbi:SGL-domain-containing protein [Sporormia fimetaria CBS 119925]|uniref:SGL-domain-containing protein n=1 Tax=Sporormia fimetaria CBS 119925 TaxID=1340428 RepID=A0A6A6VNM9_9PLEO|nr:SGL-domain-containing protein [Sporormia fimetaria CBS 119925]
MGFSKLWGGLRRSWTGGSSPGPRRETASTTPVIDEKAAAKSTTKKMPEIKKYEIKEPWIRVHCALGEGPFWEDRTNTLRFIDIEKQELHRVDLSVGPPSYKLVKKMDISMGCTADIEGNEKEFIFGGKYGYGICNLETGEYKWVKKVWSEEEVKDGKPDRMRGNDGAVDSQGRFWVGFMNDPLCVKEVIDEGAVFRLDPDLTLHRPLDKITIPNGTTWNKLDNTMYFADSPSRTISAFDFDPKTGTLSNRRTFFTMPDKTYGEGAVPDGHCIDEEGYMWTAVHGGGVVLRISPAGEIVGEIKVPTQQPTCPCFVGEDLVITSAGGTSGEDGKPIDEFAGCVFKINVGVKGLKRFRWKGGEAIEGGKVDGQVVAE